MTRYRTMLGWWLAAFIGLAQPALADDKLIQVQKVVIDVVDGKSTLVGVGKGPFTDAYPNGIDMSGKVKSQEAGKPAPRDNLAQSKISPTDDTERDFGSIGAKQGSIIANESGKDVKEIDISTKGTDSKGADNKIDSKSTDGDDFDTEISADGKTIKLKAKKGKELKPDENIWIKMPKGPQPQDKGTKIYSGKVVLAQASLPQHPGKPGYPAVSNSTGTAVVGLQINGGVQTLTFGGAGAVQVATYFNGSTTTNPLIDSIIGSQILIDDMTILGPSALLAGAYQLSDSAIALAQSGQALLHASLTNGLLIPDQMHPGFARITATLGFFEEALTDAQSRYLDEFFGISMADQLIFDSDLLVGTLGLTVNGSGVGNVSIASVIPEPDMAGMLLASTLIAAAFNRRRMLAATRSSRLLKRPHTTIRPRLN